MKVNKNVELRTLSIECRADERKVCGEAIVTNSLSEDLGGFREIIEPEALEGLIERSDIKCYYNHIPEKGVLARSRMGKGSLHLEVRNDNLYFEFEAPNTEIGNYVLEGIRRLDFDLCSFGFRCGKESWEKRDNGEYIRHIHSFEFVSEISIVPDPAYGATSVSCRSFEQFKEAQLLKELEEQRAKEELEEYYTELYKKIEK